MYLCTSNLTGKKVYEGTLTKVTPTELTMEYADKARTKTIVIPRTQVAQARLAIKF